MHLDKMIKTNVDDGGSGEKSEGDDDSPGSMEGVKSQASPYADKSNHGDFEGALDAAGECGHGEA